jgi:hypothetical protein
MLPSQTEALRKPSHFRVRRNLEQRNPDPTVFVPVDGNFPLLEGRIVVRLFVFRGFLLPVPVDRGRRDQRARKKIAIGVGKRLEGLGKDGRPAGKGEGSEKEAELHG